MNRSTPENSPTRPTIVMDLETPRTFHDVGGHRNVHLLGISVCGVYFYDTNTFRAFRVAELPEFEQYLIAQRPLVVGFNHRQFDFPVLAPYCSTLDLSTLPIVDIMLEVQKSEGVRLKLETLAVGTLLAGKSGDGLDAVRYFRAGDWERLERYCLQDVRVTRDLYEYGRRHGMLYYQNAGEARAIRIPWGAASTIEDGLRLAAQRHQQVRLTVRELDDAGKVQDVVCTFDLHQVKSGMVEGYAHELHRTMRIPIRMIQELEDLQTLSAHQVALF